VKGKSKSFKRTGHIPPAEGSGRGVSRTGYEEFFKKVDVKRAALGKRGRSLHLLRGGSEIEGTRDRTPTPVKEPVSKRRKDMHRPQDLTEDGKA